MSEALCLTLYDDGLVSSPLYRARDETPGDVTFHAIVSKGLLSLNKNTMANTFQSLV
eukprot:SAG31_NODE_29484_length_394_cov_1.220339_2_plen_56_part_01